MPTGPDAMDYRLGLNPKLINSCTRHRRRFCHAFPACLFGPVGNGPPVVAVAMVVPWGPQERRG